MILIGLVVLGCLLFNAHQAEELCQLLRENMAADPRGHKIIVFFTTARLTQFYAELCNLMVSQARASRPQAKSRPVTQKSLVLRHDVAGRHPTTTACPLCCCCCVWRKSREQEYFIHESEFNQLQKDENNNQMN